MATEDDKPDDGFETGPELQEFDPSEEAPPKEAPRPKGPAPSRVPLLLGAIVILAAAIVLIYFIAR